jgi:hypothetical protein
MPKILCVVTFFLVSICAAAQNANPEPMPSLSTLLDDSVYVFNRYDELVSGFSCDALPQDLNKQCQFEIDSLKPHVNAVKEALSAARRAKNPSLSDLFNVYRTLMEVSGLEEQLGGNIEDFARNKTEATSFVLSAGKALRLASHLGNHVQARILALERKCSPGE